MTSGFSKSIVDQLKHEVVKFMNLRIRVILFVLEHTKNIILAHMQSTWDVIKMDSFYIFTYMYVFVYVYLPKFC